MDKRALQLADEVFEEAADIRRKLHRHPELGYQEVKTSQFIMEYLTGLGLEVKKGVAVTGVIAILNGGKEGPVIALRADMDALPIEEKTGAPFASQHPGVMHACGHDMHMSMLLAAAKALSSNREHVTGTIKFIFQPAEEMLGGGKRMVEEGALKNPDVDYIFGFHVWPELPLGTIGFKAGAIMASMDSFDVTLVGKQGHGAAPHQGIDAIAAAAQIVTALQTIVSRETDPLDPIVITIGTIEAGTAYNIIPERARLKGTVRTIRPETRQAAAEAVERVIRGVGEAMRVKPEIDYRFFYPVTANDERFTGQAASIAEHLFGLERVVWLERPSMASEDFAFYGEKVPGCFAFLGVGGEHKLHSERFLPDERAMRQGIAMFIALGLNGISAE
ncbi:M20 family metallopeptidase [Paenibacillus thailandensis]|uniref:M20 family metallopeptidase n=1 Tax=Paenibacillus thailandensis TaxID=393250 RepID=A0ABW5QYF1_9BACL